MKIFIYKIFIKLRKSCTSNGHYTIGPSFMRLPNPTSTRTPRICIGEIICEKSNPKLRVSELEGEIGLCHISRVFTAKIKDFRLRRFSWRNRPSPVRNRNFHKVEKLYEYESVRSVSFCLFFRFADRVWGRQFAAVLRNVGN